MDLSKSIENIDKNVRKNGKQEITGERLNSVLKEIVERVEDEHNADEKALEEREAEQDAKIRSLEESASDFDTRIKDNSDAIASVETTANEALLNANTAQSTADEAKMIANDTESILYAYEESVQTLENTANDALAKANKATTDIKTLYKLETEDKGQINDITSAIEEEVARATARENEIEAKIPTYDADSKSVEVEQVKSEGDLEITATGSINLSGDGVYVDGEKLITEPYYRDLESWLARVDTFGYKAAMQTAPTLKIYRDIGGIELDQSKSNYGEQYVYKSGLDTKGAFEISHPLLGVNGYELVLMVRSRKKKSRIGSHQKTDKWNLALGYWEEKFEPQWLNSKRLALNDVRDFIIKNYVKAWSASSDVGYNFVNHIEMLLQRDFDNWDYGCTTYMYQNPAAYYLRLGKYVENENGGRDKNLYRTREFGFAIRTLNPNWSKSRGADYKNSEHTASCGNAIYGGEFTWRYLYSPVVPFKARIVGNCLYFTL